MLRTVFNILACLGFLALSACDQSASPVVVDTGIGGAKSSSNLTAIDIGLPDRSVWKQAVPNIESLMTGYHLSIQPTDANCAGATKVNQGGDYAASAKIQSSLKQGCDYQITLSLGSLDATTKILKATYYKNTTPHAVSKNDIANQASFRLKIVLQRTPEGAAIGLPEGDGSTTIPPPTTPTNPTTPVTPVGTGPQLTAAQDLALTGGTATKLSQLFKSEYLVIDVSSKTCGPCITLAQHEDGDNGADFRAMFGPGKKCDYAVFVPNSELGEWNGNFITGGFIATHSYGVARGPGVGEAFGIATNRTPTIFIIDKTGTVKGSAEGATPAAVNQLCK